MKKPGILVKSQSMQRVKVKRKHISEKNISKFKGNFESEIQGFSAKYVDDDEVNRYTDSISIIKPPDNEDESKFLTEEDQNNSDQDQGKLNKRNTCQYLSSSALKYTKLDDILEEESEDEFNNNDNNTIVIGKDGPINGYYKKFGNTSKTHHTDDESGICIFSKTHCTTQDETRGE